MVHVHVCTHVGVYIYSNIYMYMSICMYGELGKCIDLCVCMGKHLSVHIFGTQCAV